MRFRRCESLPACISLDNSTIHPEPDPISYVDLDLTYKEANEAWDKLKSDSPWMNSLRHNQLKYNRMKSEKLEEKDFEFPELLRLREAPCPIWWEGFKFNMINKRKKMFNEDEVNFIEETAKRDLSAVKAKIESLVSDLARLGKNLSDLKVVESKLISIIRSIEEDREHFQGNC